MMCERLVFTRRSFLRFAGIATVPFVAGCDEFPVDLVSDATVKELGLQAWREIKGATAVSGRHDMQATLDRVSAKLLVAAGETPEDWEVVVFAKPEINAFALPGKKIGVFEGIFRVVGNADQLAAIVGHEIGHLQAAHSQERINAQLTKDWGLRLISLLLRLGGVEYAAEIAAALGLGAEYGLVLPYSRRQELEADRLGLVTMASAGFEPREAVELWRRMDAATGARLPEFLATHPASESRIEAIQAMLPELRRT